MPSIPIYLAPTAGFVQTTLNGSITNNATSITLKSTTSMQAPGFVVIDRTDSSGNLTPALREVVSYTGLSGSQITGCTRGADGTTAQSHADGAVVEQTVTAGAWTGLTNALLNVVVSTTGALDTTKVADLSTAQAFSNKTFTGNYDAWISDTSTWTYASASTFTIAGDQTATYQKGTKLKFTNSSLKYAVVVSSSFSSSTTVTIAVNSDYVLANAAITGTFYSYSDNPQGYPEMFNYAAVASGSGGSAGTYAQDNLLAKFSIKGRLCFFRCQIRITNKGSWSGNVFSSLPVTAVTEGNESVFAGFLCAQSTNPATGSRAIPTQVGATSTTNVVWIAAMGATVLDWATVAVNDWITVQGFYQF